MNGFSDLLFILSAGLMIVSTLMVIFTKNIMHACIFLLGTLIGVAGLYVTLGADFVAATQLIVYVGGVVVLMVFAVMLTGGQDFLQTFYGKGRRLVPAMGSKKTLFIGFVTSIVFFLSLGRLLIRVGRTSQIGEHYQLESTVEKLGTLLVTDHVLSFEIVSILLLGALIGAAIIARPSQGPYEKSND